jgi:hypothetical protein
MIFAFMGVVEDSTGKMRNAYLVLGEDWQSLKADDYPSRIRSAPVEQYKLYAAALAKGVKPGVVFSIEAEQKGENTLVTPGTVRYLGAVPGEVAEAWGLEHSTAKAARDKEKMAKDDAERAGRSVFESLRPAAEAYHRLQTRAQRAVFLAQCIEQITEGFQ